VGKEGKGELGELEMAGGGEGKGEGEVMKRGGGWRKGFEGGITGERVGGGRKKKNIILRKLIPLIIVE